MRSIIANDIKYVQASIIPLSLSLYEKVEPET
jgi:hypothetical protein